MSTRPTLADAWSEPVNLGPTVNSAVWDWDTALSADNLSLFFTSQRSGGSGGGGDLWVTIRATTNDAWSTPLNLGPKVNSSNGDAFPGISFDGSTLYFCSNRPGGSGAFDLWQVPIHSVSKAHNPVPDDGASLEDTWISLRWSPGHTAVSRDLYLGDNFNDVNDGTPGAPGFQGNQTETMLIAGFAGFAFPDGLVPGTTYYWRAHAIEADGTVYQGDVWSFQIPPKIAWEPVPADTSKFIEPEPTLSWTAGFGSKLHTVYFGDSFDEVSNAAAGIPQGNTAFSPPGPLEPEKTYYWRVDEFDVLETHKGDVWSFTVAREGGGLRGEYFNGMNFNALVLTRTDPQINFDWGNGGPDPSIGQDNFSVIWTGQIEAAFTETYAFYTNSDDGVRLWVDGVQLIDNWTTHSAVENSGLIDLVAGQKYSIVLEYYEDWGAAVIELHWESPSTPRQLIPAAALSFTEGQ
ncbi:MAG: PA14 domain-containing protein [Planctomycetota bacterium]|jgi:hypothetical protein